MILPTFHYVSNDDTAVYLSDSLARVRVRCVVREGLCVKAEMFWDCGSGQYVFNTQTYKLA